MPGFFANIYVMGNCSMFHQSVPGVTASPLAIGVPFPYVLHNVESMKAIPQAFCLVSHTLREAGCKDLQDGEVMGLMMGAAMAEAMPTWTHEVSWVVCAYACYKAAKLTPL